MYNKANAEFQLSNWPNRYYTLYIINYKLEKGGKVRK